MHANTQQEEFGSSCKQTEIVLLFKNGELSINDFEMAGILLEWLVLEHLLPSLSNTPNPESVVTTAQQSIGHASSQHAR